MPDHRKLLLISVLVLTALLFIQHFVKVVYLYDWARDTRIMVTGLFLLICYWVLFYVLFKRILKQNEEKISIGYLTAFGCLTVLFSQVIFQSYQQTIVTEITNEYRIRIFLMNVFGSTGVAGLFAFIVALNLRLKNAWITTLAVVVLCALFYFGGPYLYSLKDQ